MPIDKLDAQQLESRTGFSKDQPLYIFCRSGNRAKRAAQKLENAGYTGCQVVEGGMVAWTEAGLPVNRGSAKVIPLERQVRIAAGFIVLAGVLLAHFVNPAFIWLSGFVGAGLIFAGITDWCGMVCCWRECRGTNAPAEPVARNDAYSCCLPWRGES